MTIKLSQICLNVWFYSVVTNRGDFDYNAMRITCFFGGFTDRKTWAY